MPVPGTGTLPVPAPPPLSAAVAPRVLPPSLASRAAGPPSGSAPCRVPAPGGIPVCSLAALAALTSPRGGWVIPSVPWSSALIATSVPSPAPLPPPVPRGVVVAPGVAVSVPPRGPASSPRCGPSMATATDCAGRAAALAAGGPTPPPLCRAASRSPSVAVGWGVLHLMAVGLPQGEEVPNSVPAVLAHVSSASPLPYAGKTEAVLAPVGADLAVAGVVRDGVARVLRGLQRRSLGLLAGAGSRGRGAFFCQVLLS